MTNRIRAQ